MSAILVSACLLGAPCRYDGKAKASADVLALSRLAAGKGMVAFCPELASELACPRKPAEVQEDGRTVLTVDGTDVSIHYQKGAEKALHLCQRLGIKIAVLKAKSPACGTGPIYDGSFSGKLVDLNAPHTPCVSVGKKGAPDW